MNIKSIVVVLVLLHEADCLAKDVEFLDRELINLYYDHPMYFLMGTPDAKAQLSFKAKAFSVTNIYLAYTQRVYWDILKTSSPIRDVNYNPSIFYRFPLNDDLKTFIDVIAYEHESNGKGGTSSRPWNRTGARFQTFSRFDNGMILTWDARAWIPLNYEPHNRDLAQCRGLYELTFTLSQFWSEHFDSNDLSFRIYPGSKNCINPLQGGRELTLRFKGESPIFLAKIVVQIFQGYAENLLDYNKSNWGFRLGVGI